MRSRLQHGYCIGVLRRSAEVTVSEGLAQGPYVAARAGAEPMSLRLKVIDSNNAPPHPTMFMIIGHNVLISPKLSIALIFGRTSRWLVNCLRTMLALLAVNLCHVFTENRIFVS